jgi:Hemerythrin HHE cation binding domain
VTVTDQATATTFDLVSHDLYRDIHKGIRTELFALTGAAGRVDPNDCGGRADLAQHVSTIVDWLVVHAEHEERHVQPTLERVAPDIAPRVTDDHAALEARMVDVRALAVESVEAPGFELRGRMHTLYLELASFTSDYLAHQDLEEREIMPILDRKLAFEELLTMHQAIVGDIPPQELAKGLARMLPAMNIDDRTELLGGMRMSAPEPVFQGVWSLAGSVLEPSDVRDLAARLGI